VWTTDTDTLARDVTFISALIVTGAQYNIDPARIYAGGMSIGGGMAFALSCRHSNRIAAVGAVAAAQGPSLGRLWQFSTRAGHCDPRNRRPRRSLLGRFLSHCLRPISQHSRLDRPCRPRKPLCRISLRHSLPPSAVSSTMAAITGPAASPCRNGSSGAPSRHQCLPPHVGVLRPASAPDELRLNLAIASRRSKRCLRLCLFR
jgi:pimeloyl-ACP methyl ester carboxylesterase